MATTFGWSSALAGGALLILLCSPAGAIDLDVDVSIGGSTGINAGVDASLEGKRGLDANASASIGGGDGVDADLAAGTGGRRGLDANAAYEYSIDEGVSVEGDEILEESPGMFGLGPAQSEEQEQEEEEKSARYLNLGGRMFGLYWTFDINTGQYSSFRVFGVPRSELPD